METPKYFTLILCHDVKERQFLLFILAEQMTAQVERKEAVKGYLLDTSICVFLLRGKRSVEERLNEIDENECYITDVVVAELLFGA